MNEGTTEVERVGRASTVTPRAVWTRLPEPVRAPTRPLIALARRMSAHGTPLPPGAPLPLPPSAVQLRTRYGGFWFDGEDKKVTSWIKRQATWEEDVLRLFRATVRPGMTVIDVGANIGFHSVVLSRLVGSSGRVHAFEPMPVTLELLNANLWRHGCANVTVHPQALSDRGGTAMLEPDPNGRSGAHLSESGFLVELGMLDSAFPDQRVDVMKVDVEGAEPLVLLGGAALIARSPGVLVVAEFRASTHLDGRDARAVLTLYESLGLELNLLRSDGAPVPATRDDILDAASRVDTINIVLRKS
ncbi:MAG TPA: FkbM family methyltransferase [Gaiellaceae bacterium]